MVENKTTATISASILGADLADLKSAVQNAEQAGCDEIHFDVMDGHFVSNISIGLPVLASVIRHTNLPIEAHMMVANPLRHVKAFAEAGCAAYTVHYEACRDDAPRVATAIKDAGMRAGLALNPETPASVASKFASQFDRMLVMTVHPGEAGQAFIAAMLPKVEQLADVRRYYGLDDLKVGVDGGIKVDNAQQAARAGADWFVSATGLYNYPEGINAAVANMRQAVKNTAG